MDFGRDSAEAWVAVWVRLRLWIRAEFCGHTIATHRHCLPMREQERAARRPSTPRLHGHVLLGVNTRANGGAAGTAFAGTGLAAAGYLLLRDRRHSHWTRKRTASAAAAASITAAGDDDKLSRPPMGPHQLHVLRFHCVLGAVDLVMYTRSVDRTCAVCASAALQLPCCHLMDRGGGNALTPELLAF